MSDLVKQRQDKLAELKQLGLDPYPQPNLEVKQSCATACQSEGQSVTVAGRLMSLRGHGKIIFADIYDLTGKIQLFFEKNTLGDLMSLTKLLDLGDIISATGTVFKTNAGEVTIRVNQFQILAKNLRPLPEKWHGLVDTEERYRQRYVDLIVNPASRQVFLTRTKILTAMRKFLDDNGFIEVETPILQPVYGGASAKPFITHHNELEQDMYLRISDELYLKRLIVGGLEKVYEVSRDFRNESISRFHNPEFTQIEFYWAYVDYDVLMQFTEKLVTHIIQIVKANLKFSFNGQELDFTPPFKRLTFRDAILEKTGIDIDQIHSEDEFFKELEIRNLKLEIADAVGLGALFDALYKETVRPFLVGPVFLTDYPAEMIALAKRKADNPGKIASFQLLACGTELLKAYNELNDPKDQSDRWLEEEKLEAKGAQNTMQMDTDYIRALEYGMPPTAGWGMGIDRFTQFLTDTPTIKDVILFPSLRSEKESTVTENNSIGLANSKVIIGQVTAVKPHPNADKLKIFDVKISSDLTLPIISGCQNLKDNDIVAVAMPGAIVYAPDNTTQKVKPTKMRGVDSPAMMCSPLELGVNQNHETIFVLPADLSQFLGQPVASHYQITKSPTPKDLTNLYHIDPAVLQKYPDIKTGIAIIQNVKVTKKDPELEKLKKEVNSLYAGKTLEDINQIPQIKAYREFFRSFGIDPASRHPSPDALLRRIVQGKGLYTINTLVDAYNVACLKTNLGMSAMDLDQLELPVTLRFAENGEKINLLGGEETKTTKSGEVVYSDSREIITLDLNYRDCDKTKITEKTKNVLVYVDGCPGISQDQIQKALDLEIELIQQFCGGTLVSHSVTK